MAELTGKTINELPQVTSLSDADLFPVSHSSAASRLTWSSFKTQIRNGFTTSSLDVSDLFGGSVTGISTVVGKKSFNTVDAYITFSGISSGTIGTIASGYRPSHTVCFPLFASSSPYAPIGAMWIYSTGSVQLYFSSAPGYAYINYLV